MRAFTFRDRKSTRTFALSGLGYGRRRAGIVVSAALIAVSLSGCLNYSFEEKSYHFGTTIEERYPIEVTQGMARLDIAVTGRESRLTGDDEIRVTDFVRGYREQGNGPFVVARPVGGGRDIASAGKVARIQRVLYRAGLQGSAVNYRVYQPRKGEPGSSVILTYSRYEATSPECGDWSTNSAYSYNNRQFGNFGCATQSNLAAMVANPRDLVAPRAMDPADAARRDIVIDAYRQGDTTSSDRTAEESGNVSAQE